MTPARTIANQAPRPRLWPAPCLLILAAIAIGVLWAIPEMQHQQRYIKTAVVLIVTAVLLLIWFVLFSRLRWTVRLSGLTAVVFALVALRLTLRIRGVNGDLLPIVETRWTARPALVDAQTKTAAPALPALDGEFTQFYGPARNATLPGPDLERDWVAHPPRILWKQPIGAGWSGFAIERGRALTMEQRGESEYVVCYELLSGKTLWTHAEEAKYATTIAGEGPRSTPTIVSNRVYTFGATGSLNCLRLDTGEPIWTRNAARENNAPLPDWGFASSPLVGNGMVLVAVGGAGGKCLAGYSADRGELLWAKGEGSAEYSSPLFATLHGTPQILLFAGRVMAMDLSGNPLWSYPWPGGHPHITPPLLIGSNQLAVSSGYGTGIELLRVDKTAEGSWNATRVWKSMSLKSKFGPLFQAGDFLYGLDDGIFCCVELKTGQRKWKDGRYGHGQGLKVGNDILLTSEKGEIVLIDPSSEKLEELARFKVFSDKTWNPPALAGEYLLMRNDKEAACVELKRKKGLEKS